jgi:hypothetical protein
MLAVLKIYLAIGVIHSAYCFLTANNQLYAEARNDLKQQMHVVRPHLRPLMTLLMTACVLFIISMTIVFWPIGMYWRSKRK